MFYPSNPLRQICREDFAKSFSQHIDVIAETPDRSRSISQKDFELLYGVLRTAKLIDTVTEGSDV
jgi:hypothetical protein